MKFNKCFFRYLLFMIIFCLFVPKLEIYAKSRSNTFGEDNLYKRVKLYWDKRINADYDSMYKLEANINKKKFKLPEYRNLFGDQANIVGYTIDKINISSEKKEATISITYTIELKIPVPGLLGHKKKLLSDDIWIFEKSNWFHVQ
ncbi:MAG: hypothetical protein HQK72_00020 [Desulfamplus sp.]|nr:hypothetical protein [Desulfamplus sp.]